MFSFARETYGIIEILNVDLNLTIRLPIGCSYSVFSGIYSDPAHANNLIVYHKPQSVGEIRFIGNTAENMLLLECIASIFKYPSQLIHLLRKRCVDLEKRPLLRLIVHNRRLLNNLNHFDAFIFSFGPVVKFPLDLLKIIGHELHPFSWINFYVEIWCEVMHMTTN